MKRLNSHIIGVEEGDVVLFSDFEDDGPMWTGTGARLHRKAITFSEVYLQTPAVMVSVSMWDMSNGANARADVQAENVTTGGFDIVFRTWGDSKVARVRVAWQSIGELRSEETWDI